MKNPEERLARFLASNQLFHIIIFRSTLVSGQTPYWAHGRNNDEKWRLIAKNVREIFEDNDLSNYNDKAHIFCKNLCGDSWIAYYDVVYKISMNTIFSSHKLEELCDKVTEEYIAHCIAIRENFDPILGARKRHYVVALAVIEIIKNLDIKIIQSIYDAALAAIPTFETFKNPFTNQDTLMKFYERSMVISLSKGLHFDESLVNLMCGYSDHRSGFSCLPREIIWMLMCLFHVLKCDFYCINFP